MHLDVEIFELEGEECAFKSCMSTSMVVCIKSYCGVIIYVCSTGNFILETFQIEQIIIANRVHVY